MNQITIGRNSQSTIVVGAEYNTVSGNHATISFDGVSYILQDHSTNGSYVNGNYIHQIGIVPDIKIDLPDGVSFAALTSHEEDIQLQTALEALKTQMGR